MITITKQKPFEEIVNSLKKHERIFLIGCGTCTTMLHTGGKAEVLDMKNKLEASGKKVAGWMVIPTACDELTKYALKDEMDSASVDCILAMTCAFGAQTVSRSFAKSVYPAMNTLFIGKEDDSRCITELCMQCGSCVLGRTAGICPIATCAKSLFNGPCGGSVGGKCEVSKETSCAWQMIIDRLSELGRLDEFEEIEPIHDWSTSHSGGPRKLTLGE